tara:strand:- start:23889 stop:26588 length:2700 start_codon:yes stop_codon:yes gene_type:complete
MRYFIFSLFLLLSILGTSQDLPKFAHFSTENGLIQNTVWALEEDYANRIWIGSQEGLQIYDGYNLTTIPNIKETIFALYHVDSSMFCLTLGNLYKIDETSFQFQKVHLRETDYYYHTFSNSKISITSSDGLKTANFDVNLQFIDSVPNPRFGRFSCREQLGDFSLEGGPNGISYYKNYSDISIPDGMVFQRIKESHEITSKYCTQLVKFDENHIFISSHKGLIEVELKNGRIVIHHHFTNHRIEKLMLDHNKNLWVGTADMGAFLIHRNAIKSTYFPIQNNKNENLTCWNIFEIDTTLFVSTSEGVRPLNSKNTDQYALKHFTEGYNCLTVTPTPNFILIGTGENGILKLQDNILTHPYINKKEALDNTIIQIIANKKGYLAISKKSIIQLDKTGNLLFTKKYKFNTSNAYAMHLAPIDYGYRVATSNGAYLLDKKLNIKSRYAPLSAKIISMTLPFQGDIWASTFDSGLVDLSTGKVVLPNQTGLNFLSIQAYKDQSIWTSSNTGIFEFSPPFIRPFTKENGFFIDEYNQMSVFKNAENELFYGGNGAVIQFHPDSLQAFPELPKVILTHDTRILQESKIIGLPFDQAKINVHIHPVIITDKNYFKVELITPDSTYLITQPEIQSLEMGFGESTFTLKITDIVHNISNETNFEVYRQIPFWKKTWFIVLSILVTILLGIGFVSFIGFIKTKKKLRLEQAENQVNEERLRISKELHDNIGARLTHIISSLDVELYRNSGENKSIESINSFARDTMAQLRETIWAVSDKTIFFSEFATRVEQYVEQVNDLTAQSISFEQGPITDFELNPVQTINYYRIVQEAINNAVKYAEAKYINVSIAQNGNIITIHITDNGKGFDINSTRMGTGIKGMKSRAQDVGVQLNIQSSLNEGTQISIILQA